MSTSKVEIVHPGRARSRREATLWVENTPCPRCGDALYVLDSGPAHFEGDAIWDVLGRCSGCGTPQHALFEEGPGWTGGRTTPDDANAVGNGRGPDPRMADSSSPSEILDAPRLRQMRDRALAYLTQDCPLDGPDLPEDPDWDGSATIFGRDTLEALYELESQARAGRTGLDPGHALLRAQVERIYRVSGGIIPLVAH